MEYRPWARPIGWVQPVRAGLGAVIAFAGALSRGAAGRAAPERELPSGVARTGTQEPRRAVDISFEHGDVPLAGPALPRFGRSQFACLLDVFGDNRRVEDVAAGNHGAAVFDHFGPPPVD